MTRPEKTEGRQRFRPECRIGSCQRHQACMYKPCRAPKVSMSNPKTTSPENLRITVWGGGGGSTAASRTITGNPWRIHCHVWDGAWSWIEFENGQRIRADAYRALAASGAARCVQAGFSSVPLPTPRRR